MSYKKDTNEKQITPSIWLRRGMISALIGVLSSCTVSLFFSGLEFAQQMRETWPGLILGLPIAGILIIWLHRKSGAAEKFNHALVLDEIHSPQATLPISMAPLTFLGTLLTQLCGGSAGREGAAVQMTASISDQFTRWLRLTPVERQSLLVTAIGSSFGAAVGTPIAGIIFGIEVTRKKLPWYCLIENAIAAGVAFFVGRFLHVSHMHLPTFPFTLKIDSLWISLVGGIIFGLTARFFMSTTHWLEKFLNQKIQNSYARIFWGGAIISTIILMEGSMRFSGFGISTILSSLAHPLSWNIPVWKALLTILTLAVGFKGGEFMPLVFIGATLGSALSGLEPPVAMDSLQSLPYLGFVAVFAGAAKTPFAGTLMAMELFGPQFGPIAFICCWVSALVSGKPHIYHPSTSRAQ